MVSLLVVTGCAPAAQAPRAPAPARDARVVAYDTYLASWSMIPLYERLELLKTSLAADVVLTSPQRTRTGLDDVAEDQRGFQKRNPGDSFRLVAITRSQHHALATWQVVDAEQHRRATGHDVLVFDERDRIKSIVMFEDEPVTFPR